MAAPTLGRPPWSGRQTGTRNRQTMDLHERIRLAVNEATKGRVKDYDPIEQMAIASMDKKVPLGLRITCHKEVEEYIYAKKRSIQVTDTEGGPLEVRIKLVDRLLAAIEPPVIIDQEPSK